MSIRERIKSISKAAESERVERVSYILQSQEEKDLDSIIKNNSRSLKGLTEELGISRDYAKSLINQGVEQGIFPAVYQEKNNSFKISPEHCHAIAGLSEHNRWPSWAENTNLKNVIVVSSQKGGVGKTTTAVNLGAGLCQSLRHRMNTVLIDMDPQGSCSPLIDLTIEESEEILTATDIMLGDLEEDSIYQSLIQKGFTPEQILQAALMPTHLPNFRIIPAFPNDERFNRHVWRDGGMDRALLLLQNKVIEPLLKTDVDTIIIDLPPSNTPIVWAAYQVATMVIMPSATQEMAFDSLCQNLFRFEEILDVLPGKGEQIREFKVLPTMYDSTTSRGDTVILERMQSVFGLGLMATAIEKSALFEASAQSGRTVYDISKTEIHQKVVKNCSIREYNKGLTSIESLVKEVRMNLLRQESEYRRNSMSEEVQHG